jgi:hypothetical protein
MNNIPNNDVYFIHYSSKKECDNFKLIFKGLIGHSCCKGKGVHVKTYNGLTVDNDEIYENIRKEYKSK